MLPNCQNASQQVFPWANITYHIQIIFIICDEWFEWFWFHASGETKIPVKWPFQKCSISKTWLDRVYIFLPVHCSLSGLTLSHPVVFHTVCPYTMVCVCVCSAEGRSWGATGTISRRLTPTKKPGSSSACRPSLCGRVVTETFCYSRKHIVSLDPVIGLHTDPNVIHIRSTCTLFFLFWSSGTAWLHILSIERINNTAIWIGQPTLSNRWPLTCQRDTDRQTGRLAAVLH